MARVYLGVQRGPFGATKLVVIKQLRAEVADDEVFISQFVDEARIALRLNHPNVVHTYDVVAEPTGYFMVMEFLEGHSLSGILRRVGYTTISLEQHVWLLTQVLAGLHYAHQLRDFDGTPLHIVHRDVSPSNVFITHTGEVKLLDFGIAKATTALSSTQEGIVKGKVGYAAPEQLLGLEVDARGDLYSVGIMLWEAMACRRRWSGGTFLATLQARLENLDFPIEEAWPEAPPSLATICRRALSPRPADRHQTALELQRELEDYLASSGTETAHGLSAFMARHFQEDSLALRQSIASSFGPGSLGPMALSTRAESSTVLELDGETEISVKRPLRARALMLAIAGAVVIVLAGALRQGLRLRGRHDMASRRSSSAISAPLAASSWATAPMRAGSAAASAPMPRTVEAAALATFTIPATSGDEQGHATSSSGHQPPHDQAPVTRRGPDAALAQTRILPEWAPPFQRPTQVPDRTEPGMDLRLRGTTHAKRSLDEKDPYAP